MASGFQLRIKDPAQTNLAEIQRAEREESYAKMSGILKILALIFMSISLFISNPQILLGIGIFFYVLAMGTDYVMKKFHFTLNSIWDIILLLMIVGAVYYNYQKGGWEGLMDSFMGTIVGTAISIFILKQVLNRSKFGKV
jgi:energy-coupling factor transporter transmembrane protein EcfT